VIILAQHNAPMTPSNTTPPMFFKEYDPLNNVTNLIKEAASQPNPIVKKTSTDWENKA
jgi:hypothetical protein